MFLKHHIRRWGLACLSLAVVGLISVQIVLADSTTGTVTINAGTLSETNSSTPTVNVTLNGSDQNPTYTLAITLIDSTGSGSGWKMTITSTQFTTGGGTPHTLAKTASTITGVTSACAASTTCTNPTNSISYPLGVPADTSAPTAVPFFNAAADTGLGTFNVTPTIAISIPASTLLGTYTSTITLAIASGPS